jgi:protein involved in polysaccharide export with SLBB domain
LDSLMKTSWSTLLRMASVILPLTISLPLAAQTPPVQEARLDTRRAQATRVELEASLATLDTILASPGYSSRIREDKRRERDLIRERLTEGDLQVGDQLAITVQNETTYTGTFIVQAGRTLALPGLPSIPLKGILRSEAEDYITKQLAKFIREPAVRVVPSIRLAVLGAVGKQGFYQVPADLLISDAIMAAGGPSGAANANSSKVTRQNTDILTEVDVADAIVRGATLDQLNLRAGDQIIVDEKLQRRGRTLGVLGVLGLVSSIVYLMTRIF